MATATHGKVKNTSGEDRIVPGLGGRLVLAGAVVDVPLEDVYSYTCQSNWEAHDTAATKAHAKGEADELERVYAERPHLRPTESEKE